MDDSTLARRLERVERAKRRLKGAGARTLTVMAAVVLGISLTGAFHFVFGAQSSWGIWTDKKGVTYAFLADYEFWFEKVVFENDPSTRRWTGKMKTERQEGIWDTGQSCWVGDRREGDPGNLIIQVGTDKCCLKAKRLGKHLVLSHVWGSSLFSDVCENRVLIKAKPRQEKPDDRLRP